MKVSSVSLSTIFHIRRLVFSQVTEYHCLGQLIMGRWEFSFSVFVRLVKTDNIVNIHFTQHNFSKRTFFRKLNSTTTSPYFMQMSLAANTINNKCIGRKHRFRQMRYNYVLSRWAIILKRWQKWLVIQRKYSKTILYCN